MFAGRPIVASNVGEVHVALADGKAGVLVEPANPTALASALDRLLSDPREAERLAEHAAAHAQAEYGLSRMVQRYVALYEAALGTTAGRVATLSPGAAPLT
jgi:glycosyltransferase involved in cell wall biosynthesis